MPNEFNAATQLYPVQNKGCDNTADQSQFERRFRKRGDARKREDSGSLSQLFEELSAVV